MMDDERLIERVRGGDREALAELFERYQKPLYNFFLRACCAADDAEDLVMETLLRVHRHADRYTGRGSFRAWLYCLALNACRDRHRRSRRRPEIPASSVEAQWFQVEDPRAATQPELMAVRGSLAAEVRAAVRALPEKERQALVLREYQQLSCAEISEALQTSLPAAKMLLHRARTRLKRQLTALVVVEVRELGEVCS